MKIIRSAAFLLGTIASFSSSAAMIQIDFEDPAALGGYCDWAGAPYCLNGKDDFTEDDFFLGTNGVYGTLTIISPPLTYAGPGNGSQYVQVGYDAAPLTLASTSTATFDFLGFDLGEYSQYLTSGNIEIAGTTSGGTVLTDSFAIDGIYGPNVAPDFQVISLSGWSDLVSISFGGVGDFFSLDNILLQVADVGGQGGDGGGLPPIIGGGSNTVPEPGTLAILGLGLLGLTIRRRRNV